MSELVADCPRCKAKEMTFDLITEITTYIKYDWQQYYEGFSVCRACNKSTAFILSQSKIEDKNFLRNNPLSKLIVAANQYVQVKGYISQKDSISNPPPVHVPKKIEEVFKEGSSCLAINCPNAAATMFRLCVDLLTKPMLPTKDENGLNSKIRRSLGLRTQWLFNNKMLPESLKELSDCIKDDGNDGAHEGILLKEEAEDIFDFTYALLERIYTEPEKVRLANERRKKRRGKKP